MKKIIHLIPYDGTGGVEVAARSMQNISVSELDFSVQCIYPHVPGYQERSGPAPLWQAFWRTLSQAPDLLIVSLWRACIVGLLMKLFQPSIRLVLMLHSTKNAHLLDWFFTTVTGRLADEWWGDSKATVDERIRGSPRKIKRVISFVTRRLHPHATPRFGPDFIFWGRVCAVKRINHALRLFAEVAKQHPSACFSIIGPNGGALAGLRKQVTRMGLDEKVTFRGEMDITQIFEEAAGACFYLQTSRSEGMAMSVVEAMQLGLVPVVTPVGEIRNYCCDGKNAILIQSDAAAIKKVMKVLENRQLYAIMQSQAVKTWQGTPLYAESMLTACRAALTAKRLVTK